MEHTLALVALTMFLLSYATDSAGDFTAVSKLRRNSQVTGGLCAHLIEPAGFPCIEHSTETKDGYLLGLQRVSSRSTIVRGEMGPPVLLIHGLFMAGDAWFMNSASESLGFILAEQGFDVWVGNVRGTRWSHGHVSLSVKNKEFWDWSWEELALYDLAEMIRYVNSITKAKILVVGHSQGTIMSLAAFTKPDIVEMVKAAALLCPISYLDHITTNFVLRLVKMRLDEIILGLGIHQLNFKSYMGTQIMDMMCEGHIHCDIWLSAITVIRKGNFAMYDYGMWRNLMHYKQPEPPEFDISQIPTSLPLWMGYGGNDALADVIDVQHTLKKLKPKPDLLYIEEYGHIDFLLSIRAKEDVYDDMIMFFNSVQKISSFK
ncbi:triacylglycerol lipase 1 isoform X2 [Nicotiana tabacum]|uniref:Lipase n=1 Tax=Nicotiana tabacum TaxID=4097 RepID=A0A1S3ZAT4_TOBAC